MERVEGRGFGRVGRYGGRNCDGRWEVCVVGVDELAGECDGGAVYCECVVLGW